MSIARKPLQLILVAIAMAALMQPAMAKKPVGTESAIQPSSELALTFNGTRYAHRWSKGTQHEFTPAGQEDLSTWQDMITLVPRQDVSDSTTLSALAEALFRQYQGAGKIIKSESTAPTKDRPAEYLLVALLPGKGFFETVFVRIALANGTGLMAVYSHRNYGGSAAEAFDTWIKANGAPVEQALMSWNGIPAPASLSKLPQSP